jgi:hypothetical protein
MQAGDIERFITSDEGEAAHDGGGYVVGMSGAGRQSFAFHGEADQLFGRKGIAEQAVGAYYGAGGAGGAGADAAAWRYVLEYFHFEARLRVIVLLQQRLEGYARHVLSGVGGEVGAMDRFDLHAGQFAFPDDHFIAGRIHGQSYNIEPAGNICYGSGGEYFYTVHLIWFLFSCLMLNA